MILSSHSCSLDQLASVTVDLLIYSLGFETRSISVAAAINATHVLALKMPEIDVHAFRKNLDFALLEEHSISEDHLSSLNEELERLFRKENSSVRVAIDISSMNRPVLFQTISRIAALCRPFDHLEVYYNPATFVEPNWQFPQIERLGPISEEFSAYDSDPLKPVCLIAGLGFETGVAIGIINQVEPRLAYCLWGVGTDVRFEAAVKRANFDFEFSGLDVKTISYKITEPKELYFLVEGLVYGLEQEYNVILVPMGPKIFSLVACLVGISYRGKAAIWRAQQSRANPPDARPGPLVVSTTIDTAILHTFGQNLL